MATTYNKLNLCELVGGNVNLTTRKNAEFVIRSPTGRSEDFKLYPWTFFSFFFINPLRSAAAQWMNWATSNLAWASLLKRKRAGVARVASSCNAFAIAMFSGVFSELKYSCESWTLDQILRKSITAFEHWYYTYVYSFNFQRTERS